MLVQSDTNISSETPLFKRKINDKPYAKKFPAQCPLPQKILNPSIITI